MPGPRILKRPNLYTVMRIIQVCDPELGITTYSFLIGSALSNRRELALYLKLLLDLGWLIQKVPWDTVHGNSGVSYKRTEAGERFLTLFENIQIRN
jgi:hypothetical protein